jgi:hypothetical protein
MKKQHQQAVMALLILIIIGVIVYFIAKGQGAATGTLTAGLAKPTGGGSPSNPVKKPAPTNSSTISGDTAPNIKVGDTIVCTIAFSAPVVQDDGNGNYVAAFGSAPAGFSPGDVVGTVVAIDDTGGTTEDYAFVAPSGSASTDFSDPFNLITNYTTLYKCPFDNINLQPLAVTPSGGLSGWVAAHI